MRKTQHQVESGTPFPDTLVILGGGQGKRMGRRKLFLRFNEREDDASLLLHAVLGKLSPAFQATLLVIHPGQDEVASMLFRDEKERFGLRIIHDPVADQGPLVGLGAALAAMESEWAFVVGCDMPEVNLRVVERMRDLARDDADLVAVKIGDYYEPLHVYVRKSCLTAVERAIGRDERKLKAFWGDVRLETVDPQRLLDIPDFLRSFKGLNTPEDLAFWRSERASRVFP